MITIIDYGMGNIGSIQNILRKIGVANTITSDPVAIRDAQKLILPGVGAFQSGMDQLHQRNLVEVLNQKVLNEKVPILGICLGMQLMTRSSEEAPGVSGLGWIDADTMKFGFDPALNLKIPHMGWNEVKREKSNLLCDETNKEYRFYFVHSYFVKAHNAEDILFSTNYGGAFTSGFQKDNIYGVQFHPEKSHKFGMDLLNNFSKV